MPTTCTPQSLYGPYYQTRFCGATVMNFTVNAGWNEQSSELSVNLVEDCSTTNKRIEYDVDLEGRIVTDADEFVEPPIGCPVYFRIGDIIDDAGSYSRNPEGGFEFSGVLQAWTRKIDVNGNPTYSVKITDPRVILEHSHIIVSDLGEAVFVAPPDLNRGQLATPNVINAYAWLDVDKEDIIRKVHVKDFQGGNPLEQHAIVGTFFFRNKDIYNASLTRLYEKNIRTNGEFYIDNLLNEAVELGYIVRNFEIDQYICWGTPNDLKTYEYWQTFFNKVDWHPYEYEKDYFTN